MKAGIKCWLESNVGLALKAGKGSEKAGMKKPEEWLKKSGTTKTAQKITLEIRYYNGGCREESLETIGL